MIVIGLTRLVIVRGNPRTTDVANLSRVLSRDFSLYYSFEE